MKIKQENRHQHRCYLCNDVATTRDHVPPIGLFPKPRPKNLITVPACQICNEKNSLHDEYFRLVVATSSPSIPASQLLHQRILPRMRRRPAIVIDLMKSMYWAEVKSKEGIHLGRARAFPADEPRIQAVIEKIIRGLYYHHKRQILPHHYLVEEYSRNPELPEEFLRIMSSLPLHEIGENGSVFGYRYLMDDQVDGHSFWFLMFFERTLFISRTIPHNGYL